MPRLASTTWPLLLVAAVGCSSLAGTAAKVNPFADRIVRADAANPAVEVACIWQPGEGRNEKGIPARGFSGQVFFFTGREREPALVDGTMRVYLFADRGTPEERAKPLRQYDFTPEAWSAHGMKTSLGPGYSVFIPYPGTEPYQVRCQLRARFTPRQGPAIWSEAVAMTLEGPPRPGQEPLTMARGGNGQPLPTIAEAKFTHRRGPAHELSDSGRAPEARRLRTDTFRLGGVEQTAYEAPQRRPQATVGNVPLDELDSATLRRMLKAANQPKPSESHPLLSDRVEPTAADHPLGGRATIRLPRSPVPAEERAVPAAPARRPGQRISVVGRDSPLTRRHPLTDDAAATAPDATTVRPGVHPLMDLLEPAQPNSPDMSEEAAFLEPDYGAWTAAR